MKCLYGVIISAKTYEILFLLEKFFILTILKGIFEENEKVIINISQINVNLKEYSKLFV